MSNYSAMSDADLMAAYKSSKDPFGSALEKEGVTGKLADVARSIYMQESSGGTNTTTSNRGARGGMQIIPGTFKSVADADWDINNPEQNMRAGIRYLKKLDIQSGGDPALTAAGYYGGPGGLEKARRGIAVYDPVNKKAAPNTLEYGQQVVARMPQRPVVDTLNKVAGAVMGSANAATPMQANAGKLQAPATAPASPFDGMSDADLTAMYQQSKTQPAKPAAPINTNPTEGNSFWQNAAAGAGKFVADTGTGIAKLSSDIVDNSPLPMLKMFDAGVKKLTGNGAQQVSQKLNTDIQETRRLDAPLMNTGGGMVGYFAGGAATAPLMPATSTIKGAAAMGGAIGVTQPAINAQERATNLLMGAGAGGAGQGVVNSLARIIRPNTSPQVTALMKEGITPTPGQILGGAFKRVEDGLTSVPIIGDSIKAGQRRAAADMNTAAMNRALKPIGETLPKGLQGRDAVEHVGSALSARYERLLPKLATQSDDVFTGEINSLKSLVSNGNMGEAEARQFGKILENQVIGKFQGQNSISGQTVKSMDGELGRISSKYMSDPSADKRQLGEAIVELQSSLRGLIQRTNPDYAKELKEINSGYANFKRIQRAAAGLGAEDGIFSPAQLQNAVKALDRSKDKGRFAKGDALMQDLSESGKNVLGSSVPDSGTPYRMAATLGASGGAGAFMGLPAAAGMLAAPLAYSRPGQNALASILTQRPNGAADLAKLLRLSGASVAGGSGAVAVQK